MSTRNLASRLKRLETRFGPGPEPLLIVIHFVDSNGKVCDKLRMGPGSSLQYLSADDEPVSKPRTGTAFATEISN
jgi:hypothetical protein